jgi:hypothetical protein
MMANRSKSFLTITNRKEGLVSKHRDRVQKARRFRSGAGNSPLPRRVTLLGRAHKPTNHNLSVDKYVGRGGKAW